MVRSTLTLSVKVAWWVKPYINAVSMFSALTGLDPDLDKIAALVFRGVKMEIVETRVA